MAEWGLHHVEKRLGTLAKIQEHVQFLHWLLTWGLEVEEKVNRHWVQKLWEKVD